MKSCCVKDCIFPSWGKDKKTGLPYCRTHQYLRTDTDKRSPYEKHIDKHKEKHRVSSEKTKVRNLINTDENKLVENKAKFEFEQKEKWFNIIRKKLTGTCQCGCDKPSSKYDDKNFRSSCCHLFPKRIFKSIQYHPNNYIERAFFGGCHTNLDEQGMDRWPKMADWELIKEKFHELAPLLTDEERSNKFYLILESLIYKN